MPILILLLLAKILILTFSGNFECTGKNNEQAPYQFNYKTLQKFAKITIFCNFVKLQLHFKFFFKCLIKFLNKSTFCAVLPYFNNCSFFCLCDATKFWANSILQNILSNINGNSVFLCNALQFWANLTFSGNYSQSTATQLQFLSYMYDLPCELKL